VCREGDASSEGEIIVAFSPAGTPETIVHLFNDVWSGWLEDEVKTVSPMKTAYTHIL
jgi:hypothetical protein